MRPVQKGDRVKALQSAPFIEQGLIYTVLSVTPHPKWGQTVEVGYSIQGGFSVFGNPRGLFRAMPKQPGA